MLRDYIYPEAHLLLSLKIISVCASESDFDVHPLLPVPALAFVFCTL